jgi:hypothetical protein
MVKTRRRGKAGVPLGKSAVLNDVILRFTCSVHAALSRYLKISEHRLGCVLPYSWRHSTLCRPIYNYVDDKAPLNKPHNRYSVWCSTNKKLIACKASSTKLLPLKLCHILCLLWKPILSVTAQGTEGCGNTCESCLRSCLPATEVDGNEAP